jgi:hypothetical protein
MVGCFIIGDTAFLSRSLGESQSRFERNEEETLLVNFIDWVIAAQMIIS